MRPVTRVRRVLGAGGLDFDRTHDLRVPRVPTVGPGIRKTVRVPPVSTLRPGNQETLRGRRSSRGAQNDRLAAGLFDLLDSRLRKLVGVDGDRGRQLAGA